MSHIFPFLFVCLCRWFSALQDVWPSLKSCWLPNHKLPNKQRCYLASSHWHFSSGNIPFLQNSFIINCFPGKQVVVMVNKHDCQTDTTDFVLYHFCGLFFVRSLFSHLKSSFPLLFQKLTGKPIVSHFVWAVGNFSCSFQEFKHLFHIIFVWVL